MDARTLTIRERVWIYPGQGAWHFITIQKPDALEIKKFDSWPRRGFGSIPVHVTIGKTTWKTSIFPDKHGTCVLPLKKPVRIAEDIRAGETVTVSLEVLA